MEDRWQSPRAPHRQSEESSWAVRRGIASYAANNTARARLRGAQPCYTTVNSRSEIYRKIPANAWVRFLFFFFCIDYRCRVRSKYILPIYREISRANHSSICYCKVSKWVAVYLNCHGSLLLSGTEEQETCFCPSKFRILPTAIYPHPY